MHAELDRNVGPKLQRLVRQGGNENTAVRAELLLRSCLGCDVEHLAADYEMDAIEIRALIVDFNIRRMRALSRKRSVTFTQTMTDEDRAVIDELIRLTPEAFGFPDMRWLADELISFVKEHGLVKGIDREYITARLREIRHRNSFRFK